MNANVVVKYKYEELQQLVDEDEPTLLAAIKELQLGKKDNNITMYLEHDLSKLRLYLNQKDRVDYLKIIEYLNEHQPIKIYPLQLALEEAGLYYRIPVLLDKYTYKDNLLWEDKWDNLWYDFDEWFEEFNLFRIAEEFSSSHTVVDGSIWW